MTDAQRRQGHAPMWPGVAGAVFILAALASNEWLLTYLFSQDGEIAASTRGRIWTFTAFCLVSGVAMIALRRPIDGAARAFMRRRPNAAAVVAGLAAAFAIFVFAEGLFWTLNRGRMDNAGVVTVAPEFRPGEPAHAALSVGGETIYDVTYTLDWGYRRVSPDSEDGNPLRHILFFGGSFTFGQGVADAETLPNHVARGLANTKVTNFAFPGHGTQHMLERIQQLDAEDDFGTEELIAVYVFIPDHVKRAIGSMRIASAWGRKFPAYSLDAQGELIREGVFATARPLRYLFYRLLAREQIMAYFGVDLPMSVTDAHLRLVTRLIEESRNQLLGKHPNTRFLVLLYPNHPKNEFDARRIKPFLEESGLAYLDYTQTVDLTQPGMLIPYDGHPTGEAHRRVARRFTQDLLQQPSL